ncbi:MAG: hypothetical protein HQK63_17640, partial [Desulfamplus sp.]|nr:hypothetical protein [Desulfamplus sp.]
MDRVDIVMLRIVPLAVGGIPVLFLSVFYFYPLAGIFIKSFFDQTSFSFLSLLKILQSSRMAGIIWFTFWQASVSTILTLIVALPCAWVMGTFDFKGKKIVMTLATLPFVLPTIVVASAFQSLAYSIKDILSNSGLLRVTQDGDSAVTDLLNWLFNFKKKPSHIHHCKQKNESGSNRTENLAILHQ